MKVVKILCILICALYALFAQTGGVSLDKVRLAPKLLNYQGYLTDTVGIPIDDSLDMTFKVFDAASSGNELWSETQTNVLIERGVFSVMLGETTPIPDSVFADFTSTWLELTLEGPQTLTPRTRITSVGYAYTSTYSDTAEYARVVTNDGDWTIAGNNIYCAVPGNVGIGITTPNTKLHVNGNTEIDGNLSMNSHTITGVTNLDIAQVQGYGIRLYSHDNYAINFGGGSEFRYGPVTAYSIKMNMADANGYGWVWGVDNQVPVAALGKDGDMQLTGNLYVVDSIGIGANPTQELDISGNMRLTGAIYDGNNEAGTNAQVLSTSGSAVDWIDAPSGNWSVTDSVLYTNNYWGIARGGANNVLYGDSALTHVNLGVACTTGTAGQTYYYCTVGGGYRNTASSYYATVGGGWNNDAAFNYATVSGGRQNIADNTYATVGGGNNNTADSLAATVGGGFQNAASHRYASVSGGNTNIASGYYATVGGGYSNIASGNSATVGGGYDNTADIVYATVGGGYSNIASGNYATVGGGRQNTADTVYTTVGGGYSNIASGYSATVSGGYNNTADTVYTTVGGGYQNTASGNYATVGGGYNNNAGHRYATVGGGFSNTASSDFATVDGGRSNTASDSFATVGGGRENNATDNYATVAGGYQNTADTVYTTIGGGSSNIASEVHATVGGGCNNTASYRYATVGGGLDNVASGQASFATNYSTNASHSYSAAFTTSHTIASSQVRAAAFSTGTLMFTMDHPTNPRSEILNQYAMGSDEAIFFYRGSVILNADGKAVVDLPDYFDKINQNPMIQLTGVGSADVVYIAEDVKGNSFVIGGKPGMKVYWEVTGERTDIHAEIARIQTPVEQQKTDGLIGHSLDDDALIGIYDDLNQKNPGRFAFQTEEGRRVHEQSKQVMGE